MSRIFTSGKYAGKTFEEVYNLFPRYLYAYRIAGDQFVAYKDYAIQRMKEPLPKASARAEDPSWSSDFVKGHEIYILDKAGAPPTTVTSVGTEVKTYFSTKYPDKPFLGSLFVATYSRYEIGRLRGCFVSDPYVEEILQNPEKYPTYLPLLRSHLLYPFVKGDLEMKLVSIWVLSLAQALIRGLIEDSESDVPHPIFEPNSLKELDLWLKDRFVGDNQVILTPKLLETTEKVQGIPLAIIPDQGELITTKVRKGPVVDLDFSQYIVEAALYNKMNPGATPITKITLLDALAFVEISMTFEEPLVNVFATD